MMGAAPEPRYRKFTEAGGTWCQSLFCMQMQGSSPAQARAAERWQLQVSAAGRAASSWEHASLSRASELSQRGLGSATPAARRRAPAPAYPDFLAIRTVISASSRLMTSKRAR